MKKIYLLMLLCSNVIVEAQVLNTSNPQVQAALNNSQIEGNPLANFFSKRTPMMDFLHMLVKDDDGLVRHYVGAEIGSAYENEHFQAGKIFYNNEELGDVYYRFNAYNNEIELKRTLLEEEKQLALVKNEEVKIVAKEESIVFVKFSNGKGKVIEGYLTEINNHSDYKIYKRIYKKFSEAKPAENSMVTAIPSRFTTYIDYYYKGATSNDIVDIPKQKSKFIKRFVSPKQSNEIKKYIKANELDLENKEDLIALFNRID